MATLHGHAAGALLPTREFSVADIQQLYRPCPLPGEPQDEMITLTFSSPNKNTLTYIYIDGTWQNLRRMVLAREQFYLRFFDRDLLTITIDERED